MKWNSYMKLFFDKKSVLSVIISVPKFKKIVKFGTVIISEIVSKFDK